MNSSIPGTEPSAATARSGKFLELAVLVQSGGLLVLASWAFGGNAPWSRLAVSVWGSVGIGLSLAGLIGRKELRGRMARWLWPFGLFNLLVFASTFNPTMRQLNLDGAVLFAKTGGQANLPGSARPAVSLGALWLFDAIYLSCFNLALLVRRRRSLRTLLLIAAANAMALAVFGTLQKLMGATGLFFGLVPSPQQRFFASFIYHNHWGSFAILMTALCLGLVAHYARRSERGFWHSPAFGGLVAVFFLAASIPLSGSRSCTLLALTLFAGAFLHWVFHLLRRNSAKKSSFLPTLAGGCLALALATGVTYKLAQPVIEQRAATTREQLAAMQSQGGIGSRAILYRDTWHMARDRLLFGWGMASYPTVFYTYNTQTSPADRLPVFYYDAHSDWLQSLAELGVIGTLLLGLHALVPLLSLRRRPRSLPGYLFAGCALVLLYAWVEFPFGNVAVVIAWWLGFFAAVRYARLDESSSSA
jgi:O-antigen ligase